MLVLYAEDDIDDFDFFCDVLKSFDPAAKCLNMRNGREAIEFLDNAVVLPDIIFLDINMPAMDGKSCLKNIKRDARLNAIPVVIYTTSQSQRDREHCMQLGAKDFIIKAKSFGEAESNLSRFFKG